jgi:hypothetical protein
MIVTYEKSCHVYSTEKALREAQAQHAATLRELATTNGEMQQLNLELFSLSQAAEPEPSLWASPLLVEARDLVLTGPHRAEAARIPLAHEMGGCTARTGARHAVARGDRAALAAAVANQ